MKNGIGMAQNTLLGSFSKKKKKRTLQPNIPYVKKQKCFYMKLKKKRL